MTRGHGYRAKEIVGQAACTGHNVRRNATVKKK
jgi:hypothetical protein